MAKFNWSSFGKIMLRVAQAAPLAVLASEQLAKQNDTGADKMAMARDSLKVLTGLDEIVDPEHAAIADQVSWQADKQLQTWVDIFNADGTFGHKNPGGDPMPPGH